MTLQELVGGEVRHYNGKSFLYIERRLAQIGAPEIVDYINQNRAGLHLTHIRRQFPDLAHIPKNKMLFLDTETCGLTTSSPIFLIGMAHVEHQQDITLQALFARNYAEESAILSYFMSLLPKYEAFFTYNGSSFDIPRITERARQNGLFTSGNVSLKHLMNGQHHDLYHIGRKNGRINLPDGKLQTIEKLIFNHVRKDDLPGEEIPQAYYEYAYGRERKARKVKANIKLWIRCRKKVEEEHNISPESTSFNQWAEHTYEQEGGEYKEVYFPGEPIDEKATEAKMARAIDHCLLDNATLVAVLAKLCS